MPSSPSRQADLRALIARPFAHRGLHGLAGPENSRAAFEAAIAAGHGIELDVQESRDGGAVVFHDYELGQLTEASGSVAQRSLAELRRIRLRGSVETIPTVSEALKVISGQVPLLIELKTHSLTVNSLCRAVSHALEGYCAAFGIMSYHPEVGRWFSRNAPQNLRGLVMRETGKGAIRTPIGRHLALWRSRADFLAYNIGDLPSRFAEAQRAKGMKVLTWTCRSLADRARAAEQADQIIYEVPAK